MSDVSDSMRLWKHGKLMPRFNELVGLCYSLPISVDPGGHRTE
jgi:hypothetical protein